MAKYSEGTVVQLKSGGPKMTATGSTDHTGRIQCQWFAGSKLEHGWFPPNTLVVKSDKDEKKK